MRPELVIELARAAVGNNPLRTRRVLGRIIENEKRRANGGIAARLEEVLPWPAGADGAAAWTSGKFRGEEYVHTSFPSRSLDDVVLDTHVRAEVDELIEEHAGHEALAEADLEPRHTVLLTGPPGNGKTSVAAAIAAALGRPLHRLSYGSAIGSYLGESGNRLEQVFGLVESHPCVLLLDEIEAISAERDTKNEMGEIRRLTAMLLVRIEETPWTTLVIGATNHAGLLDRAAWRRFDVRLTLEAPTPEQTERYLKQQLGNRLPEQTLRQAGAALEGTSYADAEQLARRFLRRRALRPDEDAQTQLRALLAARKQQAGPQGSTETR